MTKRITYTPTGARLGFMSNYRETRNLEKLQDVIDLALWQLEEEELVRNYNGLALQIEADRSQTDPPKEAIHAATPSEPPLERVVEASE